MTLNYERATLVRLEICQKIYTTGFSAQKTYTIKVRKLRLSLLKKKVALLCILGGLLDKATFFFFLQQENKKVSGLLPKP